MLRKASLIALGLAAAACSQQPTTTQQPATAGDPQLGLNTIQEVIDAMTLDEKLDIVVGSTGKQQGNLMEVIGNAGGLVPGAAGEINAVERLGIPPVVVADGPAGLRINPQREGTDQTFYCTHFPVGTVMSSTWNQELVQSVGQAMGDEVLHYGVDILLAPGTNIMRNPLNGRNFEYYSEDPLLSGKICAAMVSGIQSQGVGTSVKHFALNNQETNRYRNNVVGTPRAFRELYLKTFEITVKESQPWTIMTSYNKVNGTMTSERSDLVTEILRHEWGFEGLVMTDWGGGINPLLQMEAGNDLLMPGQWGQRETIRKAIVNGHLSMEILDRNVAHILAITLKTPRFRGYQYDNRPDLEAHAQVTRTAALEGMVLLKNEGGALPLGGQEKVAVFGRTSYDFIAGGTGSGDVNHAYVVSLIEGLTNAGLTIDAGLQQTYEAYIAAEKAKKPAYKNWMEAIIPKSLMPEMPLAQVDLAATAQANDLAIVTIGKTSGECADRHLADNYGLTAAELRMVSEVCNAFHAQGKKVVAILNVCGVVDTAPWIGGPDAVLCAWLPGQEGGNSVADLLTGVESPSGRLPMTWPRSYGDVLSRADFPYPDEISDAEIVAQLMSMSMNTPLDLSGTKKNVDITTYNDGIYVGYRHYTTHQVPVSFPFGYGLSYTTFEYGQPAVGINSAGDIEVTVSVSNTGTCAGKEVVQVYVAAPGKDLDKPARELKAFAKTAKLEPGEQQTVSLLIPYTSLASFNEAESQWQVESGDYAILVARNAADTSPLTAQVSIQGRVTEKVRPCLLPEER